MTTVLIADDKNTNSDCFILGGEEIDSGIATEQSGKRKSKWFFVNLLPGTNIDIKKAVCAYLLATVITLGLVYYALGLKFWSAFIFSIIVGQITLNIIFLPTNLNFWSEFNSYIGLYGLIQLLTPLAVFIYALVMSVRDKRI